MSRGRVVERWPREVSTVMVIAGPRLDSCPTLDDIDVQPMSVRRQSHIHLTEGQGQLAERLLGGRVGSLAAGLQSPQSMTRGRCTGGRTPRSARPATARARRAASGPPRDRDGLHHDGPSPDDSTGPRSSLVRGCGPVSTANREAPRTANTFRLDSCPGSGINPEPV